ncbi:MAG: hypothetical protein LBK55_08850 [Azoarcus sp.]|nr:hypothetical protein [Azoarcus sp.]
MHPPSGKTLLGGSRSRGGRSARPQLMRRKRGRETRAPTGDAADGKQGVVTLQHMLDDGQPPSGTPVARERAASMR